MLTDKIKHLPSSPGVYLMKDSLNTVIYVGKAKNLKRRVQSYFYDSKHTTPKIKKLVQHLKDFDIIETDTEFEAFMLECQLIQELKPPYNRLMKNPLSYQYIRIYQKGKLLTLDYTDSSIQHKDYLYFGPFTSKRTVIKAVNGIKDCFKLHCNATGTTTTACLNYHLHLCMGCCKGGEALVKHNEIVDQVIALFKGTDITLLNRMEKQMQLAAEQFDFETAAKIRDTVKAINILLQKEDIINFTEQNHLIAIIEYLNHETLKFFLVKRTSIIQSHVYSLRDIPLDELKREMTSRIMEGIKADVAFSDEKVGLYEINQAQIIYQYLKSNQCRYINISEEWDKFGQNTDKMITLLLNLGD